MDDKYCYPDEEPGCPACCLYFLNLLESLIGLSLIKSNCPHTDPKLTRCEFTYAKKWHVNIFITTIFVLLYCYENYSFLKMITGTKEFTSFGMRSLFAIYTIGAGYWLNWLRLKFQKSMLTYIDSFTNDDDIHRILNLFIFTKKHEREIYAASRRHTILYLVQLVSFIIGVIIFNVTDVIKGEAFEAYIKTNLGILSSVFSFFSYDLVIRLFSKLVDGTNNAFVVHLENRGDEPITLKIRTIRRIYLALHSSWRYFNEFHNSALVFLTIFVFFWVPNAVLAIIDTIIMRKDIFDIIDIFIMMVYIFGVMIHGTLLLDRFYSNVSNIPFR